MKRAYGFSIVELIVVIVIIAILFTIAIVTYSWMRRDAEVAAYVATVKQIEKGMRLKFTREGMSEWPRDNDLSTPPKANPDIRDLVKREEFSKYIGSLSPTVTHGKAGYNRWIVYDNDKGASDNVSFSSCFPATGDVQWNGIILAFAVGDRAIIEEIDRQMDDGNINCGRIRRSNQGVTGFFYFLSEKQAL